MVEKKAIIKNETGLHARPASLFVSFVKKYTTANVFLIKNDSKANAKSILNLLSLGLKKGSEIVVQVDGENESQILEEIIEFIENLND